jgi:hypothetical protein
MPLVELDESDEGGEGEPRLVAEQMVPEHAPLRLAEHAGEDAVEERPVK